MTTAIGSESKYQRWRRKHWTEADRAAAIAKVTAWNRENPERTAAASSAYRASHPDRHIRHTYGLSGAEYERLFVAQDGKCAACGNAESVVRGGILLRLAVDHVHETGAVRGLLCGRCNRGIGNFDDDPERLEAAARYLRSHAK